MVSTLADLLFNEVIRRRPEQAYPAPEPYPRVMRELFEGFAENLPERD